MDTLIEFTAHKFLPPRLLALLRVSRDPARFVDRITAGRSEHPGVREHQIIEEARALAMALDNITSEIKQAEERAKG